MNNPEFLIRDLPDPQSAERFLHQLSEQRPGHYKNLLQNDGLLSDVLTLVSYSPLISATLLQNLDYIKWLDRERAENGVRTKDELLESLARFALTNSRVTHNVLLARFRRRELTRIFLGDIRRLMTVPEITEGISNLADAILEYAIRITEQELQNRYGTPQELDEKQRPRTASFVIVSLGKLGSRELNYSSDVDLLFLYSNEGTTTSTGAREAITNREYFSKVAESISRLVGGQGSEGAAYRVDLRLRPHGRVGPLATSLSDLVRYYRREAQNWERQVLIRSRPSAGDHSLFQRFFAQVESTVFSSEITVADALASVRNSKQKIDTKNAGGRDYDVKVGRGGIREIEFIAQALQLAYGGRDRWLRVSHTLISLSRLADRRKIDETELTQLYDAYNFLRRLEHRLQMENGLQTHTVPIEPARRLLTARRVNCRSVKEFDSALLFHTANVRRIFERVFAIAGDQSQGDREPIETIESSEPIRQTEWALRTSLDLPGEIRASIEKSDVVVRLDPARLASLRKAAAVSRRVVELISASPHLINHIPDTADDIRGRDYRSTLMSAVTAEQDFGPQISVLRKTWAGVYFEIMLADAAELIAPLEAKMLQTQLAEASIAAALEIARAEMSRRLGRKLREMPLAIMGLGKLGSGGIDYDSDLDLIIVYPQLSGEMIAGLAAAEFYAKTVEYFVTALSGVTRDGSLYRIDLRLRPHGRNGSSAISGEAFAEYVRKQAEIWELLAFVKLRAAGGDAVFGSEVERTINKAVHRRAAETPSAKLSDETRRVRQRLEDERSGSRNKNEIDIKFGPGGMLDIYFAVRYLQLRDNVPDDDGRRSTLAALKSLRDNDSLSTPDFDVMAGGYNFLAALDHELRLTIGRTTRLPHSNHNALPIIANRLGLASANELLQGLALNRIEVRNAFERVLSS